MSADPDLLKQFAEKFTQVAQSATAPRPELAGYTRLSRQVHQVECAIVTLQRILAKNAAAYPMPAAPVSAYERWQNQRDDDEIGALFGDIYQANPKALGFD